MATDVTTSTVVSYTAFPPLRRTLACAQGMQAFLRGVSLLHYPGSCLHQTLSGILPCEARTFLSRTLSSVRQRSSILLIRSHIISSFSFSNKYYYCSKDKCSYKYCYNYCSYRGFRALQRLFCLIGYRSCCRLECFCLLGSIYLR